MLDLDLTEEEQLIITINESLSDNQLKKKENKFKALLDTYLKEQLNEKYVTADVPSDGSCLYHAVQQSFKEKYGETLEINHQTMRQRVALHMLRHQESEKYLRNFEMNDGVDNNSSSNNSESSSSSSLHNLTLKDRYVQYAQDHMNKTTHWPVELCVHIIALLYGLEIIVLQEILDPDSGQPNGSIFERLRTTGGLLLLAPPSSSSSSSCSSSTSSSSSSSSAAVVDESTTTTIPATKVRDIIISTARKKTILIGNRWDQHYYSIGRYIITTKLS